MEVILALVVIWAIIIVFRLRQSDKEKELMEKIELINLKELKIKNENIIKTKNKIIPDFLKKIEEVKKWYEFFEKQVDEEINQIGGILHTYTRNYKFHQKLTNQYRIKYISKFENGEINDLKLIIEKLSFLRKELKILVKKDIEFEVPSVSLKISPWERNKIYIKIKYKYEYMIDSVESNLTGAQRALKKLSSKKTNSKQTKDNLEQFKEAINLFINEMKKIPDWYEIIQARGNGHAMFAKTMNIKVDDYEYWANAHKEEYMLKYNDGNLDVEGINLRIEKFGFIVAELEKVIKKAAELNLNITHEMHNDYCAARASVLGAEYALKEMTK